MPRKQLSAYRLSSINAFTMRDTCIIVQTESRTSSLFECFAEVQPILYKEYTLFAR